MATLIDDIDPDLNIGSVNFDCQYIDEDKINSFFSEHSAAQDFTIMYVNCRSMPKNFDGLTTIISNANVKPSVIAITETWLKSCNENLYSIDGYSFVCNSRPRKKGGGVAIFVETAFDYIARKDLDTMNTNLEGVFIEITVQNSAAVVVGCLYRPPNSDIDCFNSGLLDILSKLSNNKNKKLTFLAGDYNIDLLKTDNISTEFINTMQSYSFAPVITKPTRLADTSNFLKIGSFDVE